MMRNEWLDKYPTARERAHLRIVRWYWLMVAVVAAVLVPFLIAGHVRRMSPERGTWVFAAAHLIPFALFLLTLIGAIGVVRFLSATRFNAVFCLMLCPVVASGTQAMEFDISATMPMYAGWSALTALVVVAAGSVWVRRALPRPPKVDPLARSIRWRVALVHPMVLVWVASFMYLKPHPSLTPPAMWALFGAGFTIATATPVALCIALRAWADNRRVADQAWMHNTAVVVAVASGVPLVVLAYPSVYGAGLEMGHPTALAWFEAFSYPSVAIVGALLLSISFLASPVDVKDDEDRTDDLDEFVDEDLTDGTPDPQSPSPSSSKARSDAKRRRIIAAATVPGQEVPVSAIKELRSGDCVYCGSPASHADHIRPVSRGGWHHIDNLVSACDRCNTNSKNAKLLVEWLRHRPDLVLHGCLTHPAVLTTFVHEMRELATLEFVYPEMSDFVREACERHGRDDLVFTERVSSVAVHRPTIAANGVPFPPVRSEDTRPDIDDVKARQWSAIGRRKARARSADTEPPFPNLAVAWARFEHDAAVDATSLMSISVSTPADGELNLLAGEELQCSTR